jgi:anti-sigma regulatory factor (Ser/Thr protein kinase)
VTARRFDYEPESVTAARRFVRRVLRAYGEETIEVAELLVSELATNSIRHSRTGFELKIEIDGRIRVEVRDTGGGKPKLLHPTPLEPSGRGLGIVEALSSGWGVIDAAQGKTVWFELAPTGERGGSAGRAAGDRTADRGRRARRGADARTRSLAGRFGAPFALAWTRPFYFFFGAVLARQLLAFLDFVELEQFRPALPSSTSRSRRAPGLCGKLLSAP